MYTIIIIIITTVDAFRKPLALQSSGRVVSLWSCTALQHHTWESLLKEVWSRAEMVSPQLLAGWHQEAPARSVAVEDRRLPAGAAESFP